MKEQGGLRFNGPVIAQGGVLAALTVVLVLGCTYVPFFQLLTNFVCPIPLAFLVLKQGLRPAILASLVVIVLLGIFLGAQGLFVAIGVVAPGVILGFGINKKWTATSILFAVALTTALTMGLIAISYGLFFKANFVTEMTNMLNESQKISTNMYKQLNIPKEELARQEEVFKIAIQFFISALPAILSASAILMAFLNYVVAGKLLCRLGYTVPPLPIFSEWRAPWVMSWGYIGAILALLAGQSIPIWKQVGMNLLFVFSFWYMLQGLANISFYLQRTSLPRPVRGLMMGGAVFLMGNFLSIVGLLDTWFDFRKLEKNTVKCS